MDKCFSHKHDDHAEHWFMMEIVFFANDADSGPALWKLEGIGIKCGPLLLNNGVLDSAIIGIKTGRDYALLKGL